MSKSAACLRVRARARRVEEKNRKRLDNGYTIRRVICVETCRVRRTDNENILCPGLLLICLRNSLRTIRRRMKNAEIKSVEIIEQKSPSVHARRCDFIVVRSPPRDTRVPV